MRQSIAKIVVDVANVVRPIVRADVVVVAVWRWCSLFGARLSLPRPFGLTPVPVLATPSRRTAGKSGTGQLWLAMPTGPVAMGCEPRKRGR